MIQRKRYKYIGRNGIITSAVLLDDIKHIPMTYIEADSGFILTDGDIKTYATLIETEDLLHWYEIVDNTKKDN